MTKRRKKHLTHVDTYTHIPRHIRFYTEHKTYGNLYNLGKHWPKCVQKMKKENVHTLIHAAYVGTMQTIQLDWQHHDLCLTKYFTEQLINGTEFIWTSNRAQKICWAFEQHRLTQKWRTIIFQCIPFRVLTCNIASQGMSVKYKSFRFMKSCSINVFKYVNIWIKSKY